MNKRGVSYVKSVRRGKYLCCDIDFVEINFGEGLCRGKQMEKVQLGSL